MRKHEEDDHQKAVIQWANLARINGLKVGDYLFSIPNGASLAGNKAQRARQMARLKAQGLKNGVSDLFLPVPRGNWHGLWIEMKSSKGRVSPSQAEWGELMIAQGYEFKVCYSASEAIAAIEEYLNII